MSELMNHLWQSTLFGVAVALAAVAFRGNSARMRSWLWVTASIKFLIPFSLLVELGTRIEAPAPVPLARADVIQRVNESFAPATELILPAPVAGASILPLILGSIWLLGTAALLVRWLGRWLAIHKVYRTARRLPVDGPVPVLAAATAVEPGIFGVFRPVLLVPEGVAERLTEEEFEAVLAHEFCHVRRGDNGTGALHMVVEALFWFHPLVWRIGSKLVEERERACDEEVLRSGKEPGVYAQGILRVCQMYLESPMACAPGVTGADLKERIRQIMSRSMPARLSGLRKALLIGLSAAAVAVPLVLGIINTPGLRGQDLSLKFEVASIRPSAATGNGTSIHTDQGGFRATNVSLASLVQFAYDAQSYQVSGGPGWVRDQRFDLTAKYEEPEVDVRSAKEQALIFGRDKRIKIRVRNLLAERFQIKLMEEIKELPIYGLMLDKGGHKLTPSVNSQGNMNSNNSNGTGTIHADGITVERLGINLSNLLGRPVRDETGLGKTLFDMEMKWSDNSASDPAAPTIFSAIREQLGLKLESKKVR